MKQDYRIAAVDKALDVLEYLAQERGEQELPEMSKALRIPKVTLFRYLTTLARRGYVSKSPKNDKYSLGLKILALSTAALDNLNLHEVALPHMRELLEQFQETVNLAVLEGHEGVYIEILESPRMFKMSSHVGGRELPHSAALGKAMLAYLPDDEVDRIAHLSGLPKRTPNTISSLPQLRRELEAVRQRGYAVDNEENEIGARCAGAPIFDRRGNVTAAVSISGPILRSSAEVLEKMGAALVEATSQISKRIGYSTQR